MYVRVLVYNSVVHNKTGEYVFVVSCLFHASVPFYHLQVKYLLSFHNIICSTFELYLKLRLKLTLTKALLVQYTTIKYKNYGH